MDVEAARQLAPHLFEGASPDHARAIAHETAAYLGVLKDQAIRNVIDNDPEGAKAKRVIEHVQARKGKPGIVFCHRLDMVEHLKRRLEAAGHRVTTLTGGMDSKAKSAARRAFSPDGDVAPSADILVTSDAGAVGMNAQRGQWVLQYDTPDTALLHAQRGGRVHRLGQTRNVELTDLIANHPTEAAARRRLAEKYELREIVTSPYEGLDDSGLAHYLRRRSVEHDDPPSLF